MSMRIGLLLAIAACRSAPPVEPAVVPPVASPKPVGPTTAIEYVHELEQIALGNASGDLEPHLAYAIRTAHDRCTPALDALPGGHVPGAPATSTLVIASCPVRGLSHPRPGIECIPPTTKQMFAILVDRDAAGFRVVQSR
jgi:hypothetical protein